MTDCIILKRCSKCKVEKTLTEFGKDGLQGYCRQCKVEYRKEHRDDSKKYQKAYYLTHREDVLKRHALWREENKPEIKQQSAVYRFQNREKIVLANALWYKKHRDEQRWRILKWSQNNPYKVRVKGHRRRALQRNAEGSHTAQELADLWIEQEGLCVYCGCDLAETKKHLDHIVPLKRGGSNWISNLAWACQHCNCSKGDKLLSEWIR